jgi:hypothetical protein
MNKKLKKNVTRMPTLLSICTRIQNEIVELSGLTPDALTEACEELEERRCDWLSAYKGPTLDDQVEEYRQMLDELKSPWPYSDDSCINGLTHAQYYFVWAYGDIEVAHLSLTQRSRKDRSATSMIDDDCAACYAVLATKSLALAKHVAGKRKHRLVQAAH